jgi:hypothetical protein
VAKSERLIQLHQNRRSGVRYLSLLTCMHVGCNQSIPNDVAWRVCRQGVYRELTWQCKQTPRTLNMFVYVQGSGCLRERRAAVRVRVRAREVEMTRPAAVGRVMVRRKTCRRDQWTVKVC